MKMTVHILILPLLLVGCSSAKKAIGNSAQAINVKSTESVQRASEIQALAQSTLDLDTFKDDQVVTGNQSMIINLAEMISSDQQYIQEATIQIQEDLHRVEDLTPWWASMIGNLSLAAIVVGVIVLLWQTGLGMIIKKCLWSIGLFIPKSAMRSAQADMKALDTDHEMAYREAVAIRRTSEPAYEAARNKLKRKETK